ncbi:E3 ubiquitin-protein ligase RNF10-like isoform X1 [Glandiceps talaboti]
MLEEEEMEKKSATRSSSAPPPNKGSSGESKSKDGARSNNGGPKFNRRREPSFPRGEPGSARKPIPQKSKAIDKRPRTRNNNGGRREEVAKHQRAEFGSPLSYGPKKINLNHLLNFTYAPRETSGQDRSWKSRNKWGIRRVRYNKEQFLQANCQFIVASQGDYTVHAADPDILVEWDLIEQVRIFSHDVPSCPICLYPPTAAKITRCGHMYCWTCILHYLSLGEKTWRKCPICYEAVHKSDLKSVMLMETHHYIPGEKITMKLMKREKGSNVGFPKQQWIQTEATPFALGNDSIDTCFVKLLVATPEQVQEQIINVEKTALETKLADKDEESESCFIEAAFASLKERERGIGKKDGHTDENEKQEIDEVTQGLEDVDIQSKEVDVSPTKWVAKEDAIVYSSAFDDEIDASYTADKKGPETKLHQAEPDTQVSSPADIAEQLDESMEESLKVVDEEKVVDEDIDKESETKENSSFPEGSSHMASPAAETGHMYYFYQAEDGQHLYLHSINVRCLIKEYGSLEHCPETITADILEVEDNSMTEELRKRLRYLRHLPLTCEFSVCELKLHPPIVSRMTLDSFAGDFLKRKKTRDRKERDEKKREKRIQIEEEKKQGKYPRANITLESNRQFPVCGGIQSSSSATAVTTTSQASSPALSITSGTSDSSNFLFGSPPPETALNPNAREFTPGSPPPVVGSLDSVGSVDSSGSSVGVGSPPGGHLPRFPSFAEMLRAGKNKESLPRPASVPAKLELQNQAASRLLSPDTEDSESEDFVPVPLYKDAFSDAIQLAMDKAALGSAAAAKQDEQPVSGGGKKNKKGKKKQLLFSTSLSRYK